METTQQDTTLQRCEGCGERRTTRAVVFRRKPGGLWHLARWCPGCVDLAQLATQGHAANGAAGLEPVAEYHVLPPEARDRPDPPDWLPTVEPPEPGEPFDLLAPNGRLIVGTNETIPGTAGVLAWTAEADGTLRPEYDGYTDVCWDGQESVGDEVIDDDGDTWHEADCVPVKLGWRPEPTR